MLLSNLNTDFWAEIDNEESYTDLVMALKFSDRDRVSLFIAVCDVDQTQAKIIDRYTEELKQDFCAYRISVDNNHLSVTRSISELIEHENYFGTGNRVIISVVGATALDSTKSSDGTLKSDRDTFFGYLQWTRESFRDFHFPIVLWVSKNVYSLMLSETPDFWSWRSGVFFFKSDVEVVVGHENIIETSILQHLYSSIADSVPLEELVQLIERTIERNPENLLLISLYNRLASSYVERLENGKFENYLSEQDLAINYFQKAINLSPESSQDLSTSLNNLAGLYQGMGRYAEAEPLYLRSLAIHEKELGANHPSTAASLNNLASLYESAGRYTEAEPLYLRSLAITEKELGANHPSTATSLNNLASLYESAGRYTEAEPLYLRSLAIAEKELGANHPNTASILNNLAGLYESTGKYTEAEPLYLRSLAIREEQLGTNHPSTAASLNNLASLYRGMDKYPEAELLYVRSLAIKEEQLGANHPSTATSLNNLAGLYESMGKYPEAEPLYVRSLAIREKELGANHPDTATSLNNLAELYRGMGRYAEAELLYVQYLQICEQSLGIGHPTTMTVRGNYAQCLRRGK